MDKALVETRMRRHGWTVTANGCWEWNGARARGYGVLGIGGRLYRTHRLAFDIWRAPIEPGAVIRHTCDNPPCVNPAHLLSGTQRDNIRDCLQRGRHKPRGGSLSGRLTQLDVATIRDEWQSGRASQRALAARFAVSATTVHRIVHHQSIATHLKEHR